MANVWENAVITSKGIALHAKMLAGGKSVKITSVKSGAGAVQSAALMNQEKVSDIKQTLTLKPLQKLDKTVILTAMLTNDGVTSAYDLRQVGFYAEDPDEGEILYMIAQNTEARHVPTAAEVPGYSLIWNFHLTISNDVNIEVNVNHAGYVTETNLEERLSNMDIGTKTGETIVATDSLEAAFFGMRIFGKSTQTTTTGAQLLNTSNCELGSYDSTDGTLIASDTSYRFNDPIAVTPGETLYLSKKVVIMEFASDGSFIRQNTFADLVYTIPDNVASIKIRTYIADFETFLLEDYMISRSPIVGWEEYSGEMPSPSPEYQQDIESIENTVINLYGKNLLKNLTSEQTFNGITYTPHGNGGIKVSGTATSSAALVLEYKNAIIGKYILSGSTTNTRVVARLVYQNGVSVYHTSYNGSIVEFEITEDVKEYNVYVEVKGDITVVDEYMHPMLRMKLASDADYEGYKTPQTLTLPYTLRGIPVDSNGNYTDQNGQQWICDEVDLNRGVYIQRISDKVYLKDLTTWAESTKGDNYAQYMARAYDADTFEVCLNNTFQMITVNDREEKTGIVKYADGHVRLSLLNSLGLSSLEEVVAWLEEIGAYVQYILLEPIETALTDEEIKVYKELHTNYPVTTIMNNSNAGMMVKYATSEMAVLVAGGGEQVEIVDNLLSADPDKALSANMGNFLYQSFTDGCNKIVAGLAAKGVEVNSNSPDDIVAGINAVYEEGKVGSTFTNVGNLVRGNNYATDGQSYNSTYLTKDSSTQYTVKTAFTALLVGFFKISQTTTPSVYLRVNGSNVITLKGSGTKDVAQRGITIKELSVGDIITSAASSSDSNIYNSVTWFGIFEIT